MAAVIVLFCLLNSIAFADVGALDHDETISDLREFSTLKANELTMAISKIDFADRYMNDLEPPVPDLLVETNYSSPDYMIVLQSTEEFSIDSVLEGLSLPDSMGTTLCFDTIYEANSVFTDKTFAVWANRLSIYDVTNVADSSSFLMYTVLIYSEDSPQIVTAFYRLDDSTYMTKTSFVYNPYIWPDSIYTTFPYIALDIWKDLDTVTIDLRK